MGNGEAPMSKVFTFLQEANTEQANRTYINLSKSIAKHLKAMCLQNSETNLSLQSLKGYGRDQGEERREGREPLRKTN